MNSKMKLGEKDERLLKYIYDEYEKNSVFQQYGQYALTIVSSLEEDTGIEFEDAGAQLEAINRLLKQGWIETEPIRTKTSVQITDKVRRLTPLGIEHVEQRRKIAPKLLKATPTAAEIIGRFFKGFLGK